METVLGDVLIGWTDFPDNQLQRCEEHKKLEAKLMLTIPENSSFLDIGCHYGDSICTLAIHAKNNNRGDIRFFAFDPHPRKCEHIRNIAQQNDLNIEVYNHCVGDHNGTASPDDCTLVDKEGVVIPSGVASYKLNDSGSIVIKTIDEYEDIINPVGFMHVDTEGWEAAVLRGSHRVLKNPENKMYLIAEYWSGYMAKKQLDRGRSHGVATATPKDDILSVLNKYNIDRQPDIHIGDRNLFFKVNF